MTTLTTAAGIAQAPVYSSDRSILKKRACYDFRDYGFLLRPGISDLFDVVPTRATEEECFLFCFPRDDVASGRWSVFNLHVFLKRTGSLEDFAHGLGESVRQVPLAPVEVFKRNGLGYSRTITMGELFKGAEAVIAFLGAEPNRPVRDSHFYFRHRYAHCYTGVIHLPGEEARYDGLRSALFELVEFIP